MCASAASPTKELTPMRILPTRPLRAVAAALGLTGLFALAAQAHHYRLESATPPAPFLRDGREDVVIEPSGIAPLGDGRRVLVADDQAAALHVVDVATGARGAPLGSSKLPPTTNTGPSWQGMAVDSEGNYYLVGSHSGKTDEERAASSVVVRFRLRSGDPPAIEDASVVRWNIAGPLEAALQAEGLDAARVAEREVGGLAVREAGGRRELVIGLRKPDDKILAVRRRHHRCAVARRHAQPPPHVRVRRRPPRGHLPAAHLAGVRPRDGRVPRPHDDGARQRVPRQHALARQQWPAECGEVIRDIRGWDEGRCPGRARGQSDQPPDRDQAPDHLR